MFDVIPDLTADKLNYLISGIHRAITENRLTTAKNLAYGSFWKRLFHFFFGSSQKSSYDHQLVVKDRQTSDGKQFFKINGRQDFVVIHSMTGDVVVRDKVERMPGE